MVVDKIVIYVTVLTPAIIKVRHAYLVTHTFPVQRTDSAGERGRERPLPAGGEQVGSGGQEAGKRRWSQSQSWSVGRLLRGDVC